MALVAATVANDGVLMRPQLVTAIDGQGRDADDRPGGAVGRVIDASDARRISAAMVEAVEGDLGRQFTAGAEGPGRHRRPASPGTAELGGTGEPHSWFIGFAPAERPRVAIAVLVEQARSGRRGRPRRSPAS